jgi:hypothetical protein
MEKLSDKSFVDCVELQVDLLNAGRPLAAFDAFFEEWGVMFANDIIFATGRKEERAKQEQFISAALSIQGLTTDLNAIASEEICVFRNRITFAIADGKSHQKRIYVGRNGSLTKLWKSVIMMASIWKN